jgi:hypothetical protein
MKNADKHQASVMRALLKDYHIKSVIKICWKISAKMVWQIWFIFCILRVEFICNKTFPSECEYSGLKKCTPFTGAPKYRAAIFLKITLTMCLEFE